MDSTPLKPAENTNQDPILPENYPDDPYTFNQERRARKFLHGFVRWFALVFLMVTSFWAGYGRGKQSSQTIEPEAVPLTQARIINQDIDREKNVDFSLFWKTWDLLKEKYVDAQSINSQDLVYGAIKGMLRATDDPYTTFFDPEESKQFNEDITGKFEGIGAEIGLRQEILTVIAPLEGAPAELAGIKAGDKILKIDDQSTADMTLEQAVDKMRGAKGTTVKLTIFRNGGVDETQEIIITRDTVNVKSTKLEFKEDNQIAVIKISRFGDDTTREFASAVTDAAVRNVKGIVIDLRNNPGGYLDAAVDMASRVLPVNKVVVIEEDSKGGQKKLLTKGGDLLSKVETVILINEGSASASEILAGALRDNRDNVTLVGKKSFGKGSVQELVKLPQGTAAKITIAKWLTPSGQQINNEGIAPKIEVDITHEDIENDRDPQMDKALEFLKEKTGI